MVAILLKGIAPIEGLAANIASIPTVFVLGIFVLALLGNLWEETSWCGFVTARLQARYGPLEPASSWLRSSGCTTSRCSSSSAASSDSPDRLPIAQLPLYATFLLIVFSGPMRILLTWIYNSTGHSIPVTALFHASINATGGAAILAMYFAGIDGVLLYAALAVFALVVIVATRGRLGSPRTDGAGGTTIEPARAGRGPEHRLDELAPASSE